MPQLRSTATKAIVLAADVSHYVGVSLDVLWTLGQYFLHYMLTEVKPNSILAVAAKVPRHLCWVSFQYACALL